ncbi:MAG: hypothetical protein IPL40_04290 [Proteobacteria bacterium]|nr:hypothetical protein [Pseudomonadota bacterium]
MGRTACLWIARFELQARLLAEPSWRGQPLILADTAALHPVVIATSSEGEAAGLSCGMSLATARAVCPAAPILPPDPTFGRRLARRVVETLYQLAPVVGRDVERAAEGTFFVELDGLTQLYPDEVALAARLQRALVEDCGLEAVVVAVADQPTSAWVVARSALAALPPARVIVPRGEDAAFLAQLPLEALPLPPALARLARLLGWTHAGELQRLPPGALLRRFGQAGVELEQRLRGRWAQRYRVEVPELIESSELHLDYPTAELEPLLFLHKSVLDRLIKQVAVNRQAIAALEVTLRLADGARSVLTRRFCPLRPTLDGRALLEFLTLWLSEAPAADAVETITMRAVEVGVATLRQLRLFERQEDLAEEALSAALGRLAAAFGSEVIVRPALSDRYLPEGRLSWKLVEQPAVEVVAVPSRTRAVRQRQQTGTGRAGRAETIAQAEGPARGSEGVWPVLQLLEAPLAVIWQGDRVRVGAHGPWQRVIASDGPCALEGEWWAEGFQREYLLLTTASPGGDRERWWVYRDRSGFHLQAYLD